MNEFLLDNLSEYVLPVDISPADFMLLHQRDDLVVENQNLEIVRSPYFEINIMGATLKVSTTLTHYMSTIDFVSYFQIFVL